MFLSCWALKICNWILTLFWWLHVMEGLCECVFFSFKFLWSVEAAVSTVVVRHVNRCVAKYSFLRLVPKEEVRVFFFFFSFPPLYTHTHTHTLFSVTLCSPFARSFPQNSVSIVVSHRIVFGCFLFWLLSCFFFDPTYRKRWWLHCAVPSLGSLGSLISTASSHKTGKAPASTFNTQCSFLSLLK